MKYTPFPQFILRTPFLPYSQLKSILSDKETLLKEWNKPEMKEAIYIASPVLYKELIKLSENTIKEQDKTDRIISSFERYISRMATRCTPFGLFAGCSIGNIGESTHIEMSDSISRTTRLDMYYLSTLFDELLKIPEIKDSIRYYPNTSLYSAGKKYRYIECKYISSARKYQITQVDQSFHLKQILKKAAHGSTKKELVNLLICDEITKEEANFFIDEIIESQILVGELYQTVTGDDFFSQVIQLIESTPCDREIVSSLKEIHQLLKKLDTTIGEVELYEKIISLLDTIKIPYEEKFLFQVDMIKHTTTNTLGQEMIREIQSTFTFLNKITPADTKESIRLFQQEFYNRYEDREVPMMEALDPERGIGYPPKSNKDISPLINDFYIPLQTTQPNPDLHVFQSLLLKKAIDCLSNKEKEIILTDEDVKDFPVKEEDLPPTMYTMFEIVRAKPDDILLHFSSFAGSCGANLLGRFAHTDERILQLVKEITQKEEELMPGTIVGEIAHLPESRIGNILSRPHIRKHELVFMAHSDLPQEQLIQIQDLYLSVRQDKLKIRSKKLNKYIVPRLTTAHNYHFRTMPAYRFLCEMQHPDGRTNLFFSWGSVLENMFPFRPRVRYKNTILSPATWLVKKEELSPFYSMTDNKKLLYEITAWRKKRAIPVHVLMPDADNKLYVDWENVPSILSLFSIIKNRSSVLFTEFLGGEQDAVAKKGNEIYLNECIVAFYKNKEK